MLTKIHKKTPVGRPNISASSGQPESISSSLLQQRRIQSASLRPGTHSFFFWTQRVLNEWSNWMQKKKSNIYANYKLRKKTASHDMQICVPWKQFLSTDWLFTVYFAVNFQTKAEKPLCFLIIFLSRQCLVCYVWIPTDVILSELFFGETIGHCWTANNNLPFQLILSLLHAFQANFTL